jgi:hypothetical protein
MFRKTRDGLGRERWSLARIEHRDVVYTKALHGHAA